MISICNTHFSAFLPTFIKYIVPLLGLFYITGVHGENQCEFIISAPSVICVSEINTIGVHVPTSCGYRRDVPRGNQGDIQISVLLLTPLGDLKLAGTGDMWVKPEVASTVKLNVPAVGTINGAHDPELQLKINSSTPRFTRIYRLKAVQCANIRVQLNKNRYRPGEQVKVRVIATTSDGQLYQDPITVILKNVDGFDIKSVSLGNENGKFRTTNFWLPSFLPPSQLGLWSIEVKSNEKLSDLKRFSVEHYELPAFMFEVEPSVTFVTKAMEQFRLHISALYPFGEPVYGNVNIFINPQITNVENEQTLFKPTQDARSIYLQLVNGRSIAYVPLQKTIDFEKSHLSVLVTLTDSVLGESQSRLFNLPVVDDDPGISYRLLKPFLTPKFAFEATIFSSDGTTPLSNANLYARVIEIGSAAVTETAGPDSYLATTDKDGRALFVLDGISSTATMAFIKVSTRRQLGYPIGEADEALNLKSPFFTVSRVNTNSKRLYVLAQNYHIQLVCNSKVMEHGLVRRDSNVGPFPWIKRTDSMWSPGCMFTVYLELEEDVYFDTVSINVMQSCDTNPLQMSTSTDIMQPKSIAGFNLTGIPLTIIGMTASDVRNTASFDNIVGGMVNRLDYDRFILGIVTPATDLKKTIEDACCGAGNFWWQLESRHGCVKSDTEDITTSPSLFSAVCLRKYRECCQAAGHANRPMTSVDRSGNEIIEEPIKAVTVNDVGSGRQQSKETLFDKTKIEKTKIATLRNYFPETWFFDDFQLNSSGKLNMVHRVPDSLTSWRVDTIYLPPGGKVCRVKPPLEITVKKDRFLTMRNPEFVHVGEQTELFITVFNLADEDLRDITVCVSFPSSICTSVNHKSHVTVYDIPKHGNHTLMYPIEFEAHGNIVIKAKLTHSNPNDALKHCLDHTSPIDALERVIKVKERSDLSKTEVSLILDPIDSRTVGENVVDNPAISIQKRLNGFTIDLGFTENSFIEFKFVGHLQTPDSLLRQLDSSDNFEDSVTKSSLIQILKSGFPFSFYNKYSSNLDNDLVDLDHGSKSKLPQLEQILNQLPSFWGKCENIASCSYNAYMLTPTDNDVSFWLTLLTTQFQCDIPLIPERICPSVDWLSQNVLNDRLTTHDAIYFSLFYTAKNSNYFKRLNPEQKQIYKALYLITMNDCKEIVQTCSDEIKTIVTEKTALLKHELIGLMISDGFATKFSKMYIIYALSVLNEDVYQFFKTHLLPQQTQKSGEGSYWKYEPESVSQNPPTTTTYRRRAVAIENFLEYASNSLNEAIQGTKISPLDDAREVTMTSLGLLTLVHLVERESGSSEEIVEWKRNIGQIILWINEKKHPDGTFWDLEDSWAAYRALYASAMLTSDTTDENLSIWLECEDCLKPVYYLNVTNTNQHENQIIIIDNPKGTMFLRSRGEGKANVKITLQANPDSDQYRKRESRWKNKNDLIPFDVSIETDNADHSGSRRGDVTVQQCFVLPEALRPGVDKVIVKFGIFAGYEIRDHHTKLNTTLRLQYQEKLSRRYELTVSDLIFDTRLCISVKQRRKTIIYPLAPTRNEIAMPAFQSAPLAVGYTEHTDPVTTLKMIRQECHDDGKCFCYSDFCMTINGCGGTRIAVVDLENQLCSRKNNHQFASFIRIVASEKYEFNPDKFTVYRAIEMVQVKKGLKPTWNISNTIDFVISNDCSESGQLIVDKSYFIVGKTTHLRIRGSKIRYYVSKSDYFESAFECSDERDAKRKYDLLKLSLTFDPFSGLCISDKTLLNQHEKRNVGG